MDYHKERFEDHSLMVYTKAIQLVALLPANEKDSKVYSHQGLELWRGRFGIRDIKIERLV